MVRAKAIGESGKKGDWVEGDKVSVLIAEDHTILREGLRALLRTSEEFEVVGEASDGRQAIRTAASLQPRLVLLDLSMPGMNGLEALKEIKKQCPQSKVVVLTVHSAEEYVLAALKAGADGYVLKDAGSTELLLALRNAVAGKPYLSPGIADKVIGGYLDGRKALKPSSAWETLTDRERQVLKLVAEGKTNKEIGDYLYISPKTVEKHRANLMRKLDLHNAAAVTAFAIEKGLVEKEAIVKSER